MEFDMSGEEMIDLFNCSMLETTPFNNASLPSRQQRRRSLFSAEPALCSQQEEDGINFTPPASNYITGTSSMCASMSKYRIYNSTTRDRYYYEDCEENNEEQTKKKKRKAVTSASSTATSSTVSDMLEDGHPSSCFPHSSIEPIPFNESCSPSFSFNTNSTASYGAVNNESSRASTCTRRRVYAPVSSCLQGSSNVMFEDGHSSPCIPLNGIEPIPFNESCTTSPFNESYSSSFNHATRTNSTSYGMNSRVPAKRPRIYHAPVSYSFSQRGNTMEAAEEEKERALQGQNDTKIQQYDHALPPPPPPPAAAAAAAEQRMTWPPPRRALRKKFSTGATAPDRDERAQPNFATADHLLQQNETNDEGPGDGCDHIRLLLDLMADSDRSRHRVSKLSPTMPLIG